jgi:DNA-binding NarL/FixJ family response regulator
MAIALSRSQHDFTDSECELLTVARPHLIQVYRNALEFTDRTASRERPTANGPDERDLQALGLTTAQARVLSRIALGASTAQIARELHIAQRTVHKHLQRTYRVLDVANRAGAASKAWGAAQTLRPGTPRVSG